jgi:hypothetical protein
MGKGKWFSAKLRFVVMVEPEGGRTLNDCIFMLRAKDFSAAFLKAVEIGEAAQKEYRNTYDQRVLWRFKEVLTLDMIGSTKLDGTEVHSEPIHLDAAEIIPFGSEFNPHLSKPIQTI